MNAIQTDARKGDWFLTYTGRQFWAHDPRPEDICIRDIAHHLSLLCRFNGACRSFYSVAQHSVHVAELLPPEHRLNGLLHDATEAYIGDMIRPVKRHLPEFQALEDTVMKAIIQRFQLDNYDFEQLKTADNVMLATERRDLMIGTPRAWSVTEAPDSTCVVPWAARDAEIRFLELYDELEAQRV